ncbi:hypothetical protein RFI_00396, partial [Reticulomyxa filosa]
VSTFFFILLYHLMKIIDFLFEKSTFFQNFLKHQRVIKTHFIYFYNFCQHKHFNAFYKIINNEWIGFLLSMQKKERNNLHLIYYFSSFHTRLYNDKIQTRRVCLFILALLELQKSNIDYIHKKTIPKRSRQVEYSRLISHYCLALTLRYHKVSLQEKKKKAQQYKVNIFCFDWPQLVFAKTNTTEYRGAKYYYNMENSYPNFWRALNSIP